MIFNLIFSIFYIFLLFLLIFLWILFIYKVKKIKILLIEEKIIIAIFIVFVFCYLSLLFQIKSTENIVFLLKQIKDLCPNFKPKFVKIILGDKISKQFLSYLKTKDKLIFNLKEYKQKIKGDTLILELNE